ncbi:MAG TPA: hypothetical protein DEB25_00680 [Desulfobulbaceae bacterium]|nr:hypothetical protein [Desulfobulbaceae bacterium]
MIAVSHADADHCNGLIFLLENFAVGALWVNDTEASGESFQTLLAVARRKGLAIHQARAGDAWNDGGMTLSCLANLAGDERNAGLVLRFQDGDFSMLFPGDIDTKMEALLMASGVAVESDILLAAHHGARASNSAALLATVRPKLVIVSASVRRAGTFPSTALVTRCRAMMLPLVTTGELGSVFVRWRQGGFVYSGWPPLPASAELGSLRFFPSTPAN